MPCLESERRQQGSDVLQHGRFYSEDERYGTPYTIPPLLLTNLRFNITKLEWPFLYLLSSVKVTSKFDFPFEIEMPCMHCLCSSQVKKEGIIFHFLAQHNEYSSYR